MITQALEEIKSRCDEVGDCWFWKGGLDGHGRPQKRHNGKVVYVRRLVRELADGKPVPKGMVVAAKCGHRKCVSPKCGESMTTLEKAQMAAQRGAYSSPVKATKMALMKRSKSWITDDLVEQIRSAPGPTSRIAAETKVSPSHVKAIRRGDARRPLGTPFSGLGAR